LISGSFFFQYIEFEIRKDEYTEEKNSIVNSNFLESSMELYVFLALKLFQAELDRSFLSIQFLKDYYACLCKKDIPEIPEGQTIIHEIQEGLDVIIFIIRFLTLFLSRFLNLNPQKKETRSLGFPNIITMRSSSQMEKKKKSTLLRKKV